MAKHGIVTIDEAGALKLEEGTGILNYVTDGLTTLFSSQKVAVGHAATVQKVALVAAGNMAGIHSATGKLGVGALGKNIYFGK
jgi:hypothetical protein